MADWYKVEPNIILTNKCVRMMRYYGLSESDVLYTFNYPDYSKKHDGGFWGPAIYKAERKYKTYTVGVMYRWNDTQNMWIILTCWSKYNRWYRSISWWWAHFTG